MIRTEDAEEKILHLPRRHPLAGGGDRVLLLDRGDTGLLVLVVTVLYLDCVQVPATTFFSSTGVGIVGRFLGLLGGGRTAAASGLTSAMVRELQVQKGDPRWRDGKGGESTEADRRGCAGREQVVQRAEPGPPLYISREAFPRNDDPRQYGEVHVHIPHYLVVRRAAPDEGKEGYKEDSKGGPRIGQGHRT